MAVKISGMMGTGSMGHNNCKFITENVDPARTEQNITLRRENLKQVYHELFDEALAEYNAKKTKTRDKIPDYYWHIEKSKQERLFHEVIFQIGNKGKLHMVCVPYAHTEQGVLYIEEQGETFIKQGFLHMERSNGAVLE